MNTFGLRPPCIGTSGMIVWDALELEMSSECYTLIDETEELELAESNDQLELELDDGEIVVEVCSE